MKRLLPAFALATLALGLAAAEAPVSSPALNWVLPIFTKEGYRSMILRGSEARLRGHHEIDVVDMNLTVFSGDPSNRVETIILSPSARFQTDRHSASGSQTVRLIRDDLEVTGTQWSYDHDGKKISIARNVRVVFHAQLHDILQ